MKTLCSLLTTLLILTITVATASALARRPPEVYGNRHHGIVVDIPEKGIGTWNVAGRRIEVTKETDIDEAQGKAEAGAFVEVTGREQNLSFSAYKIVVKLPKKTR